MNVRILSTALVILLCLIPVYSQESYTPLATMNGRSFTAQDLPPDIGNAWLSLPSTLIKARKELLEMQIESVLMSQEAAKRSLDKEALHEQEIHSKVPDPDEKAIKDLYEKNRAALGSSTLEDVRPQLVRYLRKKPEEKAQKAFIASLRTAAKIQYGKPLTSPKFSLNDVIATVNEEPITYARYKAKNGLILYEYEANVFDQVDTALRMIVDAAVYQIEASGLGIPVNRLIANEITSKLKDFSTEEQLKLENVLRSRLYAKYRVKYFITEPDPYTQFISKDDDPVLGKADAKVTIVVFADYECPACAGVHPLLKKLVAKYPQDVRLVYRDFPLVKVHNHAFEAALAANAASKQGKFFEYTELLYKNQQALDKESLKKYAADTGMDIVRFEADMNSAGAKAEVEKDIAEATRYGVTGTPSIFVNGYKVRNLSMISFEKAVKNAKAGKYR